MSLCPEGPERSLFELKDVQVYCNFLNGDNYGLIFKNHFEGVYNYHYTMDFFEAEPYMRSTPKDSPRDQQTPMSNQDLSELSNNKVKRIKKRLNPNN